MALSASSLAPKALATSICTEKTVSTANLTFAKLFFCCFLQIIQTRRIAMSLTNEEQQQKNSLAKVKLAVDTVFSVHIEVARALGASDDALKAWY
jgi:hypothetical protein